MEQQTLNLPNEVISPTDVARLVREIENLDEFFRQSAIRAGGSPQSAPRYSRLLDGVVVGNELNLLQSSHREQLLMNMRELAAKAPVLHISFSVDPPTAYVQKIVMWLRTNIDGRILVRVGLQPNIGAGCVVRTTNRSFDFSLKRFFDSKRDFFVRKLHEVVSADAGPIAVDTDQTVIAETVKPVVAEVEIQPSVNPTLEATVDKNIATASDADTSADGVVHAQQPQANEVAS